MGNQSKAKEAELRQEYRRKREMEQKEKQKKQNRITAIVSISIVAVVAIAVLIVILATWEKKDPADSTDPTTQSALTMDSTDPTPTTQSALTMDQIDLSDVEDASVFRETDEITNYVRLTVQYTTAEGTETGGDIYVRLFPEVAPVTVQNFQSLVASGYYNGTVFHRIYPGFMIQGGSGDADTIKGEFTSNGFENNLEHVRGVLSMARANDPDSASSQFFIIHQTASHLDGNYASFGYVVNGMAVVDAITNVELEVGSSASVDGTTATSPVHPVTITSAVFVTK